MHAYQRVAIGVEGLWPVEDVDGDRVPLELMAFADHLLFDDIGEERPQALGARESLAFEDATERPPYRLIAGSFDRRHRCLLQGHVI
ncbi:hypothetical protein [Ensifer adhaerens]